MKQLAWLVPVLACAACGGSPAGGAGVDDAPPFGGSGADAGAHALALVLPATQVVDEEVALAVPVSTTGGTGAVRIFVEALPPGATWDDATRTIAFTPDFTQGGQSWTVELTAVDSATRVHGELEIQAVDTIRPPAPVITSSVAGDGYTQLTVTQTTDAYLDSPSTAGRTFTAIVTVPTSPPTSLPVRVGLHGFDGTPETDGWSGEYRIFPYDPNDTYWWGYGDQSPATSGAVRDYTSRRVLNLLAWVLATYPAADPERVYIEGISMGGAGAMTIGTLHGRHFAHVDASFGQAIPANHRPSRLAQLQPLWGTPAQDLDDGYGMGAWTRMDLTRVVRDEPEGRDQFLTLKHSKDDPTIHFGAVSMPSPLTELTFYAALQQNHIGHMAIWDEGGHGDLDPVLGAQWWMNGWDPIFDTTALLRRNLAFPAFTRCSIDDHYGTGTGNGKQPWNVETGFAGVIAVPQDTGWDGDVAGGLNRFMRWDATQIVDTIDRFELPIHVLAGTGGEPPRPGYPTTGDRNDAALPLLVDVTPRRVQSFRTRPGEQIDWQLGAQSGTVTADATGAVTVPQVSLGTAWETLVLTRHQP